MPWEKNRNTNLPEAAMFLDSKENVKARLRTIYEMVRTIFYECAFAINNL